MKFAKTVSRLQEVAVAADLAAELDAEALAADSGVAALTAAARLPLVLVGSVPARTGSPEHLDLAFRVDRELLLACRSDLLPVSCRRATRSTSAT